MSKCKYCVSTSECRTAIVGLLVVASCSIIVATEAWSTHHPRTSHHPISSTFHDGVQNFFQNYQAHQFVVSSVLVVSLAFSPPTVAVSHAVEPPVPSSVVVNTVTEAPPASPGADGKGSDAAEKITSQVKNKELHLDPTQVAKEGTPAAEPIEEEEVKPSAVEKAEETAGDHVSTMLDKDEAGNAEKTTVNTPPNNGVATVQQGETKEILSPGDAPVTPNKPLPGTTVVEKATAQVDKSDEVPKTEDMLDAAKEVLGIIKSESVDKVKQAAESVEKMAAEVKSAAEVPKGQIGKEATEKATDATNSPQVQGVISSLQDLKKQAMNRVVTDSPKPIADAVKPFVDAIEIMDDTRYSVNLQIPQIRDEPFVYDISNLQVAEAATAGLGFASGFVYALVRPLQTASKERESKGGNKPKSPGSAPKKTGSSSGSYLDSLSTKRR